MRCSGCGICCTETEMLLSKRDIARLLKRGYKESDFAQHDNQGYAQLKNVDGYCFFYDRKNRKCSIYSERPSGCQVYPVIFDEDKGIILDDICPCINTITLEEKRVKGKRVIRLLEVIDSEALTRRQ